MNKFNLKKELKKQAKEILPDGSFREKVARDVNPPTKVQKSSRQWNPMPKRALYGLVATCLIVCIGLGVGLGLGVDWKNLFYGDGNSPSQKEPNVAVENQLAYVSIDINPSFGITVDEDGNVESVDALNEDAALVLLGVNFEGKPYGELYVYIIKSCVELGFLKENGEVHVVICGDKDDFVKSITETAENALNDVLTDINAMINMEFGEDAIIDAINEAGKYIEGIEEFTAQQLNEYLKGVDHEKIEEHLKQLDEKYQEFMSEISVLCDRVVTAYENNDYVTLFYALVDAYDYIVLFFEMNEYEIGDGEYVAHLLAHPENAAQFNEFLTAIAEGNDQAINQVIDSYIRGQLKEENQ